MREPVSQELWLSHQTKEERVIVRTWAIVMFRHDLKQCFNGPKAEGICGKALYQVRM